MPHNRGMLMTTHTRIRMVGLLGCCFGTACSEPGQQPHSGMFDRVGFSELAVTGDLVPEGYIDFYIGEVVLSEYEATGAFVPEDDKTYSLIRLPSASVESVVEEGDDVTLSLCDPAEDVLLVHNTAASHFHERLDLVEDCTPWSQVGEGFRRYRFVSGQPGVRGVVQVGRNENGFFVAGARMRGAFPSACEGRTGVSHGSMIIGTISDAEESADCGGGQEQEP